MVYNVYMIYITKGNLTLWMIMDLAMSMAIMVPVLPHPALHMEVGESTVYMYIVETWSLHHGGPNMQTWSPHHGGPNMQTWSLHHGRPNMQTWSLHHGGPNMQTWSLHHGRSNMQ